MHLAFDIEEELNLRQQLKLDELAEEPWPMYFKTSVHDWKFPTAEQDSLAKKCYDLWTTRCNTDPTIIVHDDLEAENLFFEHHELVAILDFGDTNIGTPEQELRQLYQISSEILQAAIEKYQSLAGEILDVA